MTYIRYKSKDRICAYPNCSDKFPYDIKNKYCPKHRMKVVSGKIEEMSFEDLMQKGLPELLDLAQGVFNAFIRNRDRDKVCISCSQPFTKGNRIEAGHYFPVKTHAGMRFNESACNGECYSCNQNDPNHLTGYKKGLQQRIGTAGVFDLELTAHQLFIQSYKFQKYELAEIIIKYRSKLNNNG